jgi:hypothetical protein
MSETENERLQAAIEAEHLRRGLKHCPQNEPSKADLPDQRKRKPKNLPLIAAILLAFAVLVPVLWICAQITG